MIQNGIAEGKGWTMSRPIHQQKRELRAWMRTRLRDMEEDARAERSARICKAIAGCGVFERAERLLAFLPILGEPELRELRARAFAAGKGVCLPRAAWDDNTMQAVLVDGPAFQTISIRHGVMEPSGGAVVDSASIDLALVPGLAFDGLGRRLGRGAGFYDRFLEGAESVVRLGVCFAEQVVGEVAAEAHDQRVDAVVTEDGILVCDKDRWGL